ncbi:MAG: hypothetical protein AAGF12_08390 [Myxococcota bacterium]
MARVAWLFLLGLIACGESAEAKRPLARPAEEFRSPRIEDALDQIAEKVQTRGFLSVEDHWRGFVVENTSSVHSVSLDEDQCYVIVANGSEELAELDLRIFAADGTELAADVEGGRGAALHYCPPHPGTHYLSVRATEGNGLFSVRRYQGPAGIDIRLDDLRGRDREGR